MSCHALHASLENSALNLEPLPYCDVNGACKLHFGWAILEGDHFQGILCCSHENSQVSYTVHVSNIPPYCVHHTSMPFTFVPVHAFDASLLHHHSGSAARKLAIALARQATGETVVQALLASPSDVCAAGDLQCLLRTLQIVGNAVQLFPGRGADCQA